MRAAKLILLSLLSMVLVVKGQAHDDDNPFKDNAEFWEGLDDDEEPYEHDFTQIPDLINN